MIDDDALDIPVYIFRVQEIFNSFSKRRVIRRSSGEMIACKGTDNLNQVTLVCRHTEGMVVHPDQDRRN